MTRLKMWTKMEKEEDTEEKRRQKQYKDQRSKVYFARDEQDVTGDLEEPHRGNPEVENCAALYELVFLSLNIRRKLSLALDVI